MKFAANKFATFVAALSVIVGVGCSSATSPDDKSRLYLGQWANEERGLPPVNVTIKTENGATTGQVFLSGVTYTWPASFTADGVVIANPASSARAPFVGVLLGNDRMKATLAGNPDVVVTLARYTKD